MGKIFHEIWEKERKGDYLGQTVQMVPHVTNLIKQRFYDIAEEENADIALIEVGGTIGDMENELYLEALRQLKNEVGDSNIVFVHLTYVPIPHGVNEQKSKPTQQSVKTLREKGIQPDIIIGRCSEMLTDKVKKKIALSCDLDKEAVITGLDVDDIYKIPLVFEQEGIIGIIHRKLRIYSPPNLAKWKKLIKKKENAKKDVNIAICGKYTNLEDSYASIVEALNHCSANLECNINLKWIETSDGEDINDSLKNVHGIIVPGGFGSRGTDGKIEVIKYARENKIPFLGLCLGMQLAVIEFARNVCGLEDADSTEINEKAKHPVIDILPEQKKINEKGGTMRLGGHDVEVKKGSIAYSILNGNVRRRFRHRYEVNPEYIQKLEENGLVFSGKAPEREIMQILEIKDHPFFMACQFHPELTSKLEDPDPFFHNFIKESLKIDKLRT